MLNEQEVFTRKVLYGKQNLFKCLLSKILKTTIFNVYTKQINCILVKTLSFDCKKSFENRRNTDFL